MTDLAATSGRVRDIHSEAERMVKTGHSQAREIQKRQHQLKQRHAIHDQYSNIIEHRNYKAAFQAP